MTPPLSPPSSPTIASPAAFRIRVMKQPYQRNAGRGLTLIELLAALGLLSIIMLAAASWLQITAAASSGAGASTRWRIGAASTLRLIQDDVYIGDLGTDEDRSRKVVIDGKSLIVKTREMQIGAVVVTYELDRFSHRLRRGIEGAEFHEPRVLLNQLSDFDCELDVAAGTLCVSLTSVDGQRLEKTFLLP